MLTLFLTEAAVGSLATLLAVPPRETGRSFFRYSVAQTSCLLLLALALTTLSDTGRRSSWLFGIGAAALIAAAGLFHTGRRRGGVLLTLIALSTASGGVVLDAIGLAREAGASSGMTLLFILDAATSGLVTGSVLMAMILGHYYLNIPGLSIRHLQRLCVLSLAALVARTVVITTGILVHRDVLSPLVALLLDDGSLAVPRGSLDPFVLVLLLVQVVFGVLASACFVFMAWRSARIRSTQSTTGILYVALIVVIMGELAGRYLVTITHLPI